MSNVVIHLLLDGKIQELHHYQGKTYVATDATDKKRTISIDGKETVVIPYMLKVMHYYHRTLWAYLYIDGNQIGRKPVSTCQTWTVNGMRTSKTSIQELVFVHPVEADDETEQSKSQSKSRCGQYGTITVRLFEAIYRGETTRKLYQRTTNCNDPAKPSLPVITKKDATKQTGGEYPLVGSNTGNVITTFGTEIGTTKQTLYDVGQLVEEMEVLYMPTHSLQILDVIPKPEPKVSKAVPSSGDVIDLTRGKLIKPRYCRRSVARAICQAEEDKENNETNPPPHSTSSANKDVDHCNTSEAATCSESSPSLHNDNIQPEATCASKDTRQESEDNNNRNSASATSPKASSKGSNSQGTTSQGSTSQGITASNSALSETSAELSTSSNTVSVKTSASPCPSLVRSPVKPTSGKRYKQQLMLKASQKIINSVTPCSTRRKVRKRSLKTPPHTTSTPRANRKNFAGLKKEKVTPTTAIKSAKEARQSKEDEDDDDDIIEVFSSDGHNRLKRKASDELFHDKSSHNDEIEAESTPVLERIKPKSEVFTPTSGPVKMEALTPGSVISVPKNRDLYNQVLISYKQKLIKQESGEEDVDLDVCYPADEEGDLFFVFPHNQLDDALNDTDVIVMGDDECHIIEPEKTPIQVVEID